MVMEPDIIKSDMAAAHDQIRGIVFVTDVWRDRQELKHRFNVGQCLPYFAVDRPDKSKWLGKLPKVLGQMGKGVKAFKDGMNDDEEKMARAIDAAEAEAEAEAKVTEAEEIHA